MVFIYLIEVETNKLLSRTYFIAGLVIGLSIAIIYNYLNSNNSAETLLIDTSVKTEKPIKEKKRSNKKKKKKSNNKKTITEINNLTIDSSIIDSNLFKIDTIQLDSIKTIDSLLIDSLLLDSIINNEDDSLLDPKDDSLEFKALLIDNSSNTDIKVSQDELIFTMLAYPKGIKDNFDCTTNDRLDSVLINNIHKNKKDGLYVEFWRSPLNYKGYRLNKSTLILYGFYEYNTINLKYTEDGFIELNYKEKTYFLQCSDDFKTL